MTWTFSVFVYRNFVDGDSEHFGQYGRFVAYDRSQELFQKPEGTITLIDNTSDHTYKLNIKKHQKWDQVIPVGICRDQYVSAIAFNSHNRTGCIIRWNYSANTVAVVTSIDRGRYYLDEGDDVTSSSDDGTLLLLKLRSRLGRGCDYYLLHIPTRTFTMVLANAYPKYDMDIRNNKVAKFIDRENNTARIVRLDTMIIEPEIRSSGVVMP
ncbi:MAG: hypothetical protein ACYC1M_06210 [Armatimonadota bacterium]